MTRSHRNPGWMIVAGYLAGATALFGQTQIGRETTKGVVGEAGTGRETIIQGEAGETGRAGGMGTVEPNRVAELQDTYHYLFNTAADGVRRPIKLGAGEGRARAATPVGLTWNVPLLQWGFRPEDAEIKIGKFYLDFRAISGTLLYSDNAYRSTTKKESGFISAIGTSLAGMFQMTENLRLAYGLNIVYLPFENEIGFADPVEVLAIGFTPHAVAELAYTFPVGNWDVDLYDVFSVQTQGYARGEGFDIFDMDTYAIDRIGAYSFRTPVDPDDYNYVSDRLLQDFFFYNRIGARASKVVPTVTRLTFGAFHDNTWSSLESGLPRSSEMVYASAVSERENMRFKPFAQYRSTHADTREGWDHTLVGGVRGPVTDYIDFTGQAGYFWSGNSPRETLLWTLKLDHEINPTMWHGIMFSRGTTYPVRNIRTGVGYTFNKILGPDLYGELAASRAEYEKLDPSTATFTEYKAAVRLLYNMNPRLKARTGLEYQWLELPFNSFEIWTWRNEIDLRLSDSVDAILTHQYRSRTDDIGLAGYSENLIIFTIRKMF